MAKGRKRKSGKRTKSGRLSRAGQPRYDKGTAHAQAMQVLYGTDGCDAIGRAFRAGLLGTGSDAKALLDTARRIASAYWAAYATGRITCTLADRQSDQSTPVSPEIARRREEWLNGCLTTADAFGGPERRLFDQLVIDVNPDCGPAWLDRLVYAQRCKAELPALDHNGLERALEILCEIADVDRPDIVEMRTLHKRAA